MIERRVANPTFLDRQETTDEQQPDTNDEDAEGSEGPGDQAEDDSGGEDDPPGVDNL